MICYNNSVLKLYNFLSRKVEGFKSSDETVGLYTCGPTVYDYVHIGNWRTFVFEDVLKRTLLFDGYKVKHVIKGADTLFNTYWIRFNYDGQTYEQALKNTQTLFLSILRNSIS